ncbi:hypothetical protein, partial [Leptospira adleri]
SSHLCETLRTLSGIDPFIAIELKRNTHLYEYLKTATGTISKQVKQSRVAKKSQSTKLIEKEFGKYYQEVYIKESVSLLNDMILIVSKRIGLLVYLKTKKELKSYEHFSIHDFESHFGDLQAIFSIYQKANDA